MEKVKGTFKTLAELKGYSSIDITSKSITEVSDYLKTEREKSEFSVNMPIKEGVMILKDDSLGKDVPKFLNTKNCRYYIYFRTEDKGSTLEIHLEAYLYMLDNYELMGLCAAEITTDALNTKITKLEYKETLNNDYLSTLIEQHREALATHFVDRACFMLITSLLYVSLIQANKQTIYKESKGMSYASNVTSKKTVSTAKIQVLNEDKVAYIMTGSKDSIKSFRAYKRHTESWDVLGHFRHYKNDLIKWIQPYTKGKGKKDPKTYLVK